MKLSREEWTRQFYAEMRKATEIIGVFDASDNLVYKGLNHRTTQVWVGTEKGPGPGNLCWFGGPDSGLKDLPTIEDEKGTYKKSCFIVDQGAVKKADIQDGDRWWSTLQFRYLGSSSEDWRKPPVPMKEGLDLYELFEDPKYMVFSLYNSLRW